MGQRLNIEILDDGERLANAYYHWSAYTSSAVILVEDILNAYLEVRDTSDHKLATMPSVSFAVTLLQATGAGVDAEERRYISTHPELYDGIIFLDAVSRNVGLLSVSEDGMNSTEQWAEGCVSIDLRNKTISFSVLWFDDKESYEEEQEEDDPSFEDYEVIDVDPGAIPFDNFWSFVEILEENEAFRIPSGYLVSHIG